MMKTLLSLHLLLVLMLASPVKTRLNPNLKNSPSTNADPDFIIRYFTLRFSRTVHDAFIKI